MNLGQEGLAKILQADLLRLNLTFQSSQVLFGRQYPQSNQEIGLPRGSAVFHGWKSKNILYSVITLKSDNFPDDKEITYWCNINLNKMTVKGEPNECKYRETPNSIPCLVLGKLLEIQILYYSDFLLWIEFKAFVI